MIRQDERVDPRGQVLGLISEMHRVAGNVDRVRTLSDQMEVLVRSYMEPPAPDPFPGIHLTMLEARLMSRLFKAPGEPVSRSSLMDAMYYDRPEPNDPGGLQVIICKLRRKLNGTRFRIPRSSSWSAGWRGEIVEPEHERRQQAIYDRIQARIDQNAKDRAAQ